MIDVAVVGQSPIMFFPLLADVSVLCKIVMSGRKHIVDSVVAHAAAHAPFPRLRKQHTKHQERGVCCDHLLRPSCALHQAFSSPLLNWRHRPQ